MTRSPHPVERPILRLLLLALMGLALASRLALGATLPVAGSTGGANANDPLAKLQAATIMCHTGNGRDPSPAKPQPLLSDLLLFDLADNAHALNAGTVAAPPLSWRWFAAELWTVHPAGQAPLRRAITRARAPPAIV